MTRPVRGVLRQIERTIGGRGQHLIQPEFQLDGWTTSVSADRFNGQNMISLNADHCTHEQFHSEFKTDLDLERVPSGKFDTNYIVCALAALTMNILRMMVQANLHRPDAPVRHEVERRRLKTVMQELVYRAWRLIEHGRRLILRLGANDRAAKAFAKIQGKLCAVCGQRAQADKPVAPHGSRKSRTRRASRRGQLGPLHQQRPPKLAPGQLHPPNQSIESTHCHQIGRDELHCDTECGSGQP